MKSIYRVACLFVLIALLIGTNGSVYATGPTRPANVYSIRASAANNSIGASLRLKGSFAASIYLPLVEAGLSGNGNILLMAGDICKYNPGGTDFTGNCKKTGDLIRSVLAANPGAQVQTLGDNVNNEPVPYSYDSQYQDLYAPNWGSF